MLGRTLGRYRLLAKLGEGGMGEVYRAHDDHLDREVAVKILPARSLEDEAARRRLRNEALALSRLDHPNIATVFDFDSHEGIEFLITEMVGGQTLSECLAAGPLVEKEVLKLGEELAAGLAAAHERGVLHRDLKPGNLRLTTDGRLKVLDFGLATRIPYGQALADTVSSDQAVPLAGTLLFMAPEQLSRGVADVRTDLYSAGVVLYWMATARHPFQETLAAAVIDAILHKTPPPPRWWNPALSSRLEQVILRCLEKDPEHRYQSARDLLADLRRAATPAAAERSLAVLYFENLRRDPEDEYFRDGITEDITTELAKIKGLHVFSRSAVLPYRDKPITPAHVGQQLGASHVLEGSLRREGPRLRLTANLVEAATGHSLWAERYDRQMEDVFAIQDEIAHSIARALRVVLSETEKQAIGKVPTADVEAYDSYLRGRHFFHQFRRKGLDFARQMFERAIAVDPGYARAYAGIADCCSFLFMYWESTPERLEQAEAASQKALELDPDLAETHSSRGLTASLRKNYELAEREFRLAMRLDPALFEPYYFLGRSFYAQGKLEEAVPWFEQASRVCPEDYQAPMLLASAYHGLKRPEEAHAAYRRGLAACQRHLELHPGDARALYFGANALTQLNDHQRSLEWAGRAVEMEPDEPQVLYNVACVYALLGEVEKALDCLERSVTRGHHMWEWMLHDPDLAAVRGHPRYQVLAQRSPAEAVVAPASG